MATQIYTGVWTNWSRGQIVGATLTLNSRDGGLLTAFIATFVTIVGAQLWKILSYAFHQLSAGSSAKDALHHQRQIVFRNSPTPGSAAWTFLQQAWAWRGKTKSPLVRTVPWALFGAAYIVLFALLAVFSSQISAAPGTARLVIGGACGAWYTTDYYNDEIVRNRKQSNDSLTAQTYARSCYDRYDALFCSRLTKSTIATTSRTNVSCPWPGMCLEGENAAFQVESEVIDSRDHLGINAADDHRVTLQLRTTCAPLVSDDYTTMVNGTYAKELTGDENNKILRFWYGPVNNENEELVTNHTFIYSTYSALGHLYDASPRQNHAEDHRGAVGWQPIPELMSTDADVALVFIAANNVKYSEPIDDLIFAAHEANDAATAYYADNWVTALGCAEQYRFCKLSGSSTPQCTKYLGEIQVMSAFGKLNPNDAQNRTMNRISDAIYMTIFDYIRVRNAQALQAGDGIVNFLSPGLPVNQWMREVQGWFYANLAGVQHAVVEWATGPSDPALAKAVRDMKKDDFDNQMCKSQMVRQTTGTISFSILGMALLFFMGGAIIGLSLVIDSLVGLIQKRSGLGEKARLGWITDDKLQLHRSLSNRLGLGVWEDGEQVVPTTKTRVMESWSEVGVEKRDHGYQPVSANVVTDGSQYDGRGVVAEHFTYGYDNGVSAIR